MENMENFAFNKAQGTALKKKIIEGADDSLCE